MKKKLRLLLPLCLLAVVLLVGCQNNGDAGNGDAATVENGDVVYIDFPSFQVGVNTAARVVARLIDEFNVEFYGRYQIVLQEVPGDANYFDLIMHQLGIGQLPPVVYGGGNNLLDPLLAHDMAVDLTDVIQADPEWYALFDEGALEVNSRNGRIYASSNEGFVIGYFFNQDLFDEAGIDAPATTWDEFFDQLAQLYAAGITPVAMDTADAAWVTRLWFGAMVATASDAGLELMQTMNPTDYTTPEVIDALYKIQRMLQNYTNLDAIGGRFENARNNFFSGNAAILANGPWMIGDFFDEANVDPAFAESVGTAMFPGGFVYASPIQGFIVTRQDDPRLEQAAIEMVRFFTSARAQQIALEMQGMVPASNTVPITDEVKEAFPLLAMYLESTAGATMSANHTSATKFANVLDVWSRELPRLYSGDITPTEFAEFLTEAAQQN